MQKKYKVSVNGKDYLVEVEEIVANDTDVLEINKEETRSSKKVEKVVGIPKSNETQKEKPISKSSGRKEIISPMAGTILEVFVSEGDKIAKGQKVLILEAMKMEHSILSDFDGTVSVLKAKTGQNVDAGEVLAILE
ncbi:MAG: glutaconyl-CoA/methylmalonyl-CoA decarboxylase subunit gamma [Kosmotogales bacterium]|nr:glutaconyl-CoA/methylmalonyl-CoA decarboxylase subunit gamma [Kosmotogales bacterium]